MKKAIKRIAALAMALTIAGAGTSVSGVFSANVLTAEAATVSANYVSGALLKRAEFVNWIYIKAQRPNVTDPSVFSDSPNNSQYVKPIMWAYKNGIVSGYAGGKFGVNDPITFEQAAQILYNHAKYARRDTSYRPGAAKDYKISDWARRTHAVDWAVTHNILLPTDTSNSYNATGLASASVCNQMIKRYEKNILHI